MKYLLLLCLLLGCAVGCSDDKPDPIGAPNTDSQTHWMETCSFDDECGDLMCICGVCTEECTDTCDSGAVCVSAEDAKCALGNVAAVCTPECNVNTPCPSPLSCQAGMCVQPNDEQEICPDPVPPPGCPPDRIAQPTFDANGCTIGYECVPTCPPVVPDPQDCGPGEAVFEGEDENGCTFIECVPAAQSFACGDSLFCSQTGHFCQVVVPGVPGAETSYTCTHIPDTCADDRTCSCILPFTEGTECSEGEAVTVTTILP